VTAQLRQDLVIVRRLYKEWLISNSKETLLDFRMASKTSL